jgi:hypothetical protein
MFGDVGSIKRIHIERVQLLLKSTAFIQFVNGKKARLAAIKKDQIVFADSVIRVYVVWSRKESLTTVQVSNLPLDVTEGSLLDYFSPYGDIVDIDFNKTSYPSMQENEDTDNSNSWCDEKMSQGIGKERVAWISFARVDYALRACQEMDHSIISSAGDNARLCVKLVNPDARNAKWKRNLFEFLRCSVPSKRTRTNGKSAESGANRGSTASKINENGPRVHSQSNSSSWFTSQVNGATLTANALPSMYGGAPALNANIHQSHRSVPKLPSSNVKNTNGSSNFVLCRDPGFGNGGMPSCAYGPLLFPNTGFISNGNVNTFLTAPHNSNFVTPPLSSSGSVFPAQLVSTSPNVGPFLSTQMQMVNSVDGSCSYAWSQNQIPTLHSTHVGVGAATSAPSVISGTTGSNQSSANSSVANSGVKVVITDSPNGTCLKKTSSTASTTSTTSSVSSHNSNASSSTVWSNKQREIGDVIYRELQAEFPTRVAKLTGMLLSLPKDELNRLLADSHKLKARAHQFCQLLDSK